MKKIKTSKHNISDLNFGKNKLLQSFIKEYKNAVRYYVNYLWNNKISISNDRCLDIVNDKLDCPQFISTTNIKFETKLSARALKSASTQACGIVKAALDKRKRLLYVRQSLAKEGKRTRQITKKINKTQLIKPDLSDIKLELNSLNCKIESSSIKYFDTIITLSSLGKSYGKIIIPIQKNKHSRKLETKSKMLTSILLSENQVDLRWEYSPTESPGDKEVGADTGINSVITLSDGQATVKDIHGYSLNSILKKIGKKRKGSKSFDKALTQRDNFIRWSINQLNLSNVKEIRLEKVSNFRYKKNVGKFLNYSGEALIRSKLIDFAEDHGVRVVLQSSAYRSQRCSQCGFVYSSNRKGKLFSCKHCSFQADADYNASCNHEQKLPSANWLRYRLDKPKKFFWKEVGFFNLDGSELTVPDTKKNKI
jgi:transposase